MKKDYIFKFILLLIPVTAFVLMSNSGGREQTLTGSPGDSNATCAQCHSGGNFGISPTISIDIPNTGYGLDTDYTVTVSGGAAPKHGFQITAERTDTNAKVGTFIADSNAKTKTFNSDKSLTHTIASTSLNENSWTFKWKSPSANVGDVKFYVAMVGANGNGGTTGDQVATTSTGSFKVLGLAKENQLEFTVYPNPVSEYLNIQLPTGTTKASINVFDMSGKLIRNSVISVGNTKVDVSDLTSGVYVLKLDSEGKLGSRQFIKE